MKELILTIGLISSISCLGQTNRINHYSHSGKTSTINIFTANDNMGLGCGQAYKTEYIPHIDTNTIIWDSASIDTTNKVCTPPTTPQNTMRAIERKADTSSIYNRGLK